MTTRAPELEVSLLGAALALQAQRFVSVDAVDGGRTGARSPAGPSWSGRPRGWSSARRSTRTTARMRARTASSRSPASTSSSGCGSASCSTSGTRSWTTRRPRPRTPAERDRRAAHVRAVEAGFAGSTVREAVAELADRGRARQRGARPRPALRRPAGERERPRPDGRPAGRRPRAAARQPLQGRRRADREPAARRRASTSTPAS